MRAHPFARRDHLALPRARSYRGVVIGLVIAVLALAWPASPPAHAGDPRIEKAQEQRRTAQGRLDEVLQRLRNLEAGVTAAEGELEELKATVTAHREHADEATTTIGLLAQAAYRRGSVDPALTLLASKSPGEALDQARLLGLVAQQSRAGYEAASAARIRTQVSADAAAEAAEKLRDRRDELARTREEAATLVAAAERDEQEARTVVQAEREAAEAKRAAEKAARAAQATKSRESSRSVTESRPARGAASASGSAPEPESAPASAAPGPPASASGGNACPVGQPRNYSDTYGAPRSGGRSHKGTDILAPRGTGIYAYESGTISRMNSNRLGGISLYLNGASGTSYYYTHLQGYVGGLSAGQQVSAGQQIAYNGDTGNARGIPHLHFEVMPGGGGNVNPYPYVRRACG